MKPQLRMSRKLSRGTASVEGVVVLPVFVILFIGAMFFKSLSHGKLEADQIARSCAWQYSNDGCADVPPDCGDVVNNDPVGLTYGDVSTAWSDGVTKLEHAGVSSWIVDSLADTVLDALAKALTENLSAEKRIELERPHLFGGGITHATGKYHVACNLKSRTQKDIVDKVWSFLIPGG
ncbi:MAG TPA: TadE family protein [Polyangiaceae bacterium]